ncbi:carbon storage regulator CsrA [Pseudomonas sp. SJZ085]|jgi:carbon storage regulator|nr:carbon storage regulator CsrA [Pseudomonas sp. SJZ075]TWC21800.1 carbon storage regulator CsrA [Pseudomonas sp. SJZ074]TWC32149.1 carbon storage regulator CsrA [Pseudomonas sp. SJZ078]TWC39326.1 carbon storage regulator CsrA [Pseudomonas sp. SJZ085]TWC53348.1 carbon storage regulator CsrA [Pseudomonas sp. SJZ124]TWC87863.1 carbon storage regulator CsrA [Pseudomonas sp. SJZ101]
MVKVQTFLRTRTMLVLSRAVGELISIGDDISVRVLSVSGTTVRFGVEAPRHIDVHRFEIYEKIQRKKNQVARKA